MIIKPMKPKDIYCRLSVNRFKELNTRMRKYIYSDKKFTLLNSILCLMENIPVQTDIIVEFS